jgi:hypothetical protein
MQEPDTRQELADALQAVVDERNAGTQSTGRVPTRPPAAQHKLLGVGAAGAVLLAWLWIARPAAVFDPAGEAFLSADQREAIARYALYLERARVDAFVADSGHLPPRLADAGEVEADVVYRTDGANFALEFKKGAILLRLDNRMNADSFLGDALVRIPRPKSQ